MKLIKFSILYLLSIFVLMGGCSKSSPPLEPQAPAAKNAVKPQTEKNVVKPVTIPAASLSVTSSMTTTSSFKTVNPSLAAKPNPSVTSAISNTLPVKSGIPPFVSKLNSPVTSANPTSDAKINPKPLPPAPTAPVPPVYVYNPEGRKDPFKAFLQGGGGSSKVINRAFPLLNYPLSDLKLVAVIIVKKHKFLAMVQTPDGKGYTVKPGVEIGVNHGKVIEITDHSISIEEEFIENSGEKKKRTVVLSLRPPEEGQL